jgi:TusA-related sulfurtransferase/ferredoxin
MGRLRKNFVKENCNYCGLCAQICPVGAIEVNKDNGKLIFHEGKCIGCGDCVYSCPTNAWQKSQEGYVIFLGGKMGKFPKLGIEAFDFVETKEKVLEIIEKTLEFYKKFGEKGERFRDTLDRAGMDKYKDNCRGLSQDLRREARRIGAVPKDTAETLNLEGISCPNNFVRTKLKLEDMQPGQILEVILDDGEPIKNVPRAIKDEGHEILNVVKIRDKWKLLIKKQ